MRSPQVIIKTRTMVYRCRCFTAIWKDAHKPCNFTITCQLLPVPNAPDSWFEQSSPDLQRTKPGCPGQPGLLRLSLSVCKRQTLATLIFGAAYKGARQLRSGQCWALSFLSSYHMQWTTSPCCKKYPKLLSLKKQKTCNCERRGHTFRVVSHVGTLGNFWE